MTMPEKYIVSLLGRRDGSSLVAKQNRFANYYAVSGARVVSKENFMKDISWLSSLKLRGSYGILGNLLGNFTSGCKSFDDER